MNIIHLLWESWVLQVFIQMNRSVYCPHIVFKNSLILALFSLYIYFLALWIVILG